MSHIESMVDLVQKKNPSASQMDGGVELVQVAVPHHVLPQTLAVGKLHIHHKALTF
jgi:hypothetical protein